MSEVDEPQCICRSAYRLYELVSVPIILQHNLLLSNPSFLLVTPCHECIAYQWFFLRGTIRWKLILTVHLYLVPSQRMRGDITVLHSNQLRYLLYCSTETIWHALGTGCNFRRYFFSYDSDKPSKAT
jgi:hypothetical protein